MIWFLVRADDSPARSADGQNGSTISPLKAFDDLAGFFDGFMLAAKN
ncbi:MAG: hypothetical protein AAF719_05710 [Pseudomonadota bacterium]